jgi:hypothetical protein
VKHVHPTDVRAWIEPPDPGEEPEPGYDAWLAEEIERGQADIAAGRVVPLEEVKKELGLE